MDINTIIKQIKDSAKAHFDESIEVIINLGVDVKTSPVRILVNLPHGTGKSLKVEAVDSKNIDSFLVEVEKGKVKPKVDFDILIATPDVMPKLSKVARILGSAGCMPNPKNATITKDIEKTKKELAKGRLEVKTEQNAPIIHTVIGKVSFDENKLIENYEELIKEVKATKPTQAKAIIGKNYIKSVFVKSSMGKSHKTEGL